MSRVVDIIASGGVRLSPRYPEFADVVADLVDSLVGRGVLNEGMRGEAVRAVCDRETISSTVMVEIGVSIPHARLDGVHGVVGAMAVRPGGVYEAMKGVPITIVVLVLSASELAGEHLNVLAGLSMLLQSEAVRDDVVRADTERTVLEVLREQSARSGI